MIKNILIYRTGFLLKAMFCLWVFLALGSTQVMAQFAITEDFRGTGNADIIIGGPGGTEGMAYLTSGVNDPVNGGFLRLTNSNTYQKGYAYVNKSFPSTMGVLVDFEYKMWRDVNDGNGGADGIGVFLYNAASTFQLGGYGGSLGYAPNNPTTGLAGGYVGVGLDAYGNYSNASEGRVGGPGETPNAVVLRGITTNNTGTTNRYLTGVSLGNRDGGNGAIRGRNEIDYNTQTTTRPTDAQFYRRVQIEIVRLDAAGIYYKIIVRWKKTPGAAFTDLTEYTTTDIPPALLKLGFAASSGASRNYHEIRNLLVTTPGNLRVVKRSNKDILRTNDVPNGTITYTIEVTNDTDFEVQNVGFNDRITDSYGNPIAEGTTGFNITSITTSGFVSASLPSAATLTTNEITGSLVLGAHQTGTITVTGILYTVPPGNILQNTANVTYFEDSDLNNNTSTVRTPVIAEGVDIILAKTVTNQCIGSGLAPVFTVYASNIGALDASYSRFGTSGARIAFYNIVPPGYTYNDDITVNDFGGFAGEAGDPQNDNVTARWSKVVLNNTPAAGYTTIGYIARGTDPAGAPQTLASGATYPYPVKYTMTPPGGTNAYTDVSTALLFSDLDFNNSIEAAENQANNTSQINMYVRPGAPTVPTGTIYYCLDEAATALTATASGSNTLRWYTTPNGFSSEFPITPNTNWSGTFTYYVSQVNGDCEGPQTPITVTVGPATPGTLNAAAFVCPGTATNITGSAITNATYRWQSAPDINGPWTTISGTGKDRTSGNLTVSTYFRRLTTTTVNGKTCEGPTNALLISVNNPGTIGDPQAFCNDEGNAVTLYSVVAPVGTVTGYQWERSTNGTNGWNNVPTGGGNPNGTNETYNPANTNTSYYYRRIVSFSGCTLTSNMIRVSIDANAPTGGVISGPGTVCNGATATLNNGTPGGPSTVSYQWQSSSTISPFNWVDIPGATDAAYTTGPITATTYYRRLAINPCGTGTTGDITVNVNTPTPGSLGATRTICYNTLPGAIGGTTTGSSNGTGSGNETYRWEAASGSSGGTFTAVGPTGTTATTYTPTTALTTSMRYRRYVKSDFGCEVYTELLILVKQQGNPGVITGAQTVCSGSTPIITGTQATSDDAIAYQWQISANGTNGWTAATGVNTGQNYSPTVTGYYRRSAILTPAACGPLNSNVVLVTFRAAVSAGTMSGNQTICYNTTATITGSNVTISGATVSYRWESSANSGGPFTTAAGTSNGQNYTTQSLTATTYFRRIVISTIGGLPCESPAPAPVMITVPNLVAGTISENQTVCQNNNIPAPLTSAPGGDGSGTGMSYQWQSSSSGNPSGSWNNVGTNSPTYAPPALGVSLYFRRLVLSTTNGVACQASSNIILVTVTAPPSEGSLGNNNQPVCYGGTPTAFTSNQNGSLNSPGGVLSYAWQSSTDSGATWSADIYGATGPTYTPPGPVTQNTLYRRYAVATYGSNFCRSYSAAGGQLRVMPNATGGSILVSQTICSGSIPPPITNDQAGTNANGGYIWQVSTDNISFTDINTTPTYNTTYTPTSPITVTTYYRRLGVSSNDVVCRGTIPSNVVVMTVVTTPPGGTAGSNQTICSSGTPSTLNVTGGIAGTYRWDMSTTSTTGPWSPAGGTGASFSPGILTTTTYYRRTTLAGTCASDGYSNTVTITVLPAINGGTATADQNICNGGSASTLSVTGSAAGTYRWEVSTTNLAGSWGIAPAPATGATYSPGTLNATRYYRRATISGSCEGYSNTVTITVSAPATSGSIAGTQTICMDTTPAKLGSTTVNLGTGTGTITYRWEWSANGTTGWTVIPGATTGEYQPLVLHATRHYRRTTIATSLVSGNTATCESSPTGTVIVTTKNCKVITNPMVRQRVN